jgi:peptidyl-prolyl cis-trans isomerase D
MGDQQGRSAVLYKMIASYMLREAAIAEGLMTADATEQDVANAVREVQQRHFPPPPQPSEQALRTHYDKHLDQYVIPEQVRVRQILLRVAPNAPEDDIAEALARAKAAFERLRAGEAFAVVASDVTENADLKADGGDMGFIPLVKGTDVDKVLSPLDVGEFTEVLRSERGFEIFQLVARRDPIQATFDQARDAIEHELTKAEFDRRRAKYLKELAETVEITIALPEYSGAHPLKRKGTDADLIQ